MLTIVPVTPENRAQAELLRVFPHQTGFIESVRRCMEEADQLDLWHPVCIMDADVMIGFSMYGYFQENGTGRLWFDRLLIDRQFQNRGYGKQAVRTVLEEMRKQYPIQDIYLSVYEDNPKAIGLYQFFGFRFNGELDINGEKVMVLSACTALPSSL